MNRKIILGSTLTLVVSGALFAYSSFPISGNPDSSMTTTKENETVVENNESVETNESEKKFELNEK